MYKRKKDLEKLVELRDFREEAMDNMVYVVSNSYSIYAVREASATHYKSVQDWYKLFKKVELNYDWLKV